MKRLTDPSSHSTKDSWVPIALALIDMVKESSFRIRWLIEGTGFGTILITVMLFVIPDVLVRTFV
jgi:hypothetical protein